MTELKLKQMMHNQKLSFDTRLVALSELIKLQNRTPQYVQCIYDGCTNLIEIDREPYCTKHRMYKPKHN